jgi:hypothetical protein
VLKLSVGDRVRGAGSSSPTAAQVLDRPADAALKLGRRSSSSISDRNKAAVRAEAGGEAPRRVAGGQAAGQYAAAAGAKLRGSGRLPRVLPVLPVLPRAAR